MGDELVVHQKSSLIERLDSKPGAIGSDNPFYWYIHLKSLGKRAQTKEMVEEAVNGFNVDNHAYTILKVIAKKYLTRDVCEIAVHKNGLNLKYVPSSIGTHLCASRRCKATVALCAMFPRRYCLETRAMRYAAQPSATISRDRLFRLCPIVTFVEKRVKLFAKQPCGRTGTHSNMFRSA